MNKIKIYVILALVVYTLSCNSSDDISSREMSAVFIDTLGVYSGDSTNTFQSISDIQINANGSVYIVDMLAGRVLVYDSTFTFSGTIGNRGNGPGQFQFPTSISFDYNDGFIVVDPSIQTIHYYSSNCEYIKSIRSEGYDTPRLCATVGDSTYIVDYMTVRITNNIIYSGHTLCRIDTNGEIMYEYCKREGIHDPEQSTVIGYATDPIRDRLFFYYVGNDLPYEIVCTSFAGDTLYTIAEDYEPVVKTQTELDAEAVSSLRVSTDPTERIAASENNVVQYRPAIYGIIVTTNGQLWVNSGFGDTPSPCFKTYDVLTGMPEGTVFTNLPGEARLWQYREHDGTWFSFVRNPSDYPRVIKFRLR